MARLRQQQREEALAEAEEAEDHDEDNVQEDAQDEFDGHVRYVMRSVNEFYKDGGEAHQDPMKLAPVIEEEFCGTSYGRGVLRIQNAFKKKMREYGESLQWCSLCKHKWFDTVLVKASDDDDNEICKTCASQQEKYNVALFSHVNGMDPHDNFRFLPTSLPKPYMMKEMLFARTHVVMWCYILHETGTHAYRGNVLNIEQNIEALVESVTCIPHSLKDLPVYMCVRRQQKIPGEYKDFKV